jgi:hypothetical protein
VTTIEFTSSPYDDHMYLVSTSADARVRFWQWNPETNEFNAAVRHPPFFFSLTSAVSSNHKRASAVA